MRPELEHIELIESYLLNQLSQEDKLAFEAKMLLNADLTDEVNFQRHLMDRVGVVSMRGEIELAHHRFIAGRSGWGWNSWIKLLVAIGSLAIVGILILKNQPEITVKNQVPVVIQTEQSPETGMVVSKTGHDSSKLHVYQEILPIQIENSGNTSKAEENMEPAISIEGSFDSLVKPKTNPPPAKPLSTTEHRFNLMAEQGGHFVGGGMFIHVPPFAFKENGKYIRGNINLVLTELGTEAEVITAVSNGDGFLSNNGSNNVVPVNNLRENEIVIETPARLEGKTSTSRKEFSNKNRQAMFSLFAYKSGKVVEWSTDVPVYVELPIQGNGKNLTLEYFEYKENNAWQPQYQLTNEELDHVYSSEMGEAKWEAMYYPLKRRFTKRMSDRVISAARFGKDDEISHIPWDSEKDKKRKKAKKQVDFLPKENEGRSKYYHYKGIRLDKPGLYALTDDIIQEDSEYVNIKPTFVAEDHFVKGVNRIFYIHKKTNAIKYHGFIQTIPYYLDGDYDLLVMTSFHRRYYVKCENLPIDLAQGGEVEIAVTDITNDSKTHEDLQRIIREGEETWEERAIRTYIEQEAEF